MHFSILAVAHKRHHNLGASWAQRIFLALKDAPPLGNGINFFWRCNYSADRLTLFSGAAGTKNNNKIVIRYCVAGKLIA